MIRDLRSLIMNFGVAPMLLLTQCQVSSEDASTNNSNENPPNIVFFLVDDLGWADVGYNGSTFYETPNIDGMAKESVQFNYAYAAAHTCSPTRASILTGKYPASINLTDWLPGRKDFDFQRFKNVEINQHLPFEETTLAEALKQHGYSTAIYGKWHLGEDPSGPLNHGFDIQVPDWNKGWPLSYIAPFKLDGIKGENGEYLTDRLTDEALGFIENNKEKPFFLYLSHFAVHDPIVGPPELVEKYKKKLETWDFKEELPYILESNPDAQKSLTDSEQISLEVQNKSSQKNPGDALTEDEQRELLQKEEYQGYNLLPNRTVKIKQRQDNIEFAAMIENMDNSLGRVLAKLEELGLEENTIVIFYSDNGGMAAGNYYYPERKIPEEKLDEAFSTSNLPLRGAKGWLYEGGVRVPLLVKWPKAKAGTKVDVPVTSPDLYPSILEMAGLPPRPEQHKDGVSLVPLLKGQDEIDREAIYWHIPHYSNHGMQSPGGAVLSDGYKLLDYFENNSVQLFNIKNDPGELNDLSDEMPEKVAELRNMLQDWRQDVSAKMMEPNPEYKGTIN